MKVLLVKMSSLGDVFHTLPAVQDAWLQCPGIEFDWVVEEAFADIPTWHPAVGKVFPIAWRRWRKELGSAESRRDLGDFFRELRQSHYDVVLDAQGKIVEGGEEGVASNVWSSTGIWYSIILGGVGLALFLYDMVKSLIKS